MASVTDSCLSESGGVSDPSGSDLRVCEPGHGSLRAAQRAADRRAVHQGGVRPAHHARPHACFQAAGAHSGTPSQKQALQMTIVCKLWLECAFPL